MLAKLFSRRPSHATVVAYLALFVALGGTTYAAATIGASDIKDNAVHTNHIKNGEVKNADLGSNSVGNGKLAPGSVTADKVKDETLSGGDIKNFSLGAADVAPNAIVGGHVIDDSLKGADVDESSLDLTPEALHLVVESDRFSDCTAFPGLFCFAGNPLSGVGTSWGNYGNGYAGAGYWKGRDGVVHLQGSIKATADNGDALNSIFYLPVGYRPVATHLFATRDNSEGDLEGAVEVKSTGEVRDGSSGKSVYISLDGIDFRP
ncbi:MAG TPA: hypothetical protein VJT75_03975 [Thermoleophilaceae bacterium]|nr:hypothetical protein [Thermoleophilaceae bacterium]